MKKICSICFVMSAVLMLCIGLSTDVWAGEMTVKEDHLTEEERYNPKYYKPVGENTAGKRRARAALGKSLEEVIVSGLLNLEYSIDISEYQMSLNEFRTAYFQILNDYPELFYVNQGYGYYSAGDYVARLLPSYKSTDRLQIQKEQEKLDQAANEAVSMISADMEDYEKALVVHDWLAKYCSYDYDRLNNNTVPNVSHDAYGALVNRIAVCDGYAKAYVYILRRKLGISCGIVSSTAMNHAWNMIQLGENYYHVDVTWDDPVWDSIGRARHEYFLLSDDTIQNGRSQAHTGWASSVKAKDTSYENAHWLKTDSGVIYYEGAWYFTDDEAMKIKKTENMLNGTTQDCYTFSYWRTSDNRYYTKSFSYLWRYRNRLIFNGADAIYGMTFSNGEVAKLYQPAGFSAGTCIYGFGLEGETMQYALQTTPTLQTAQSSFIRTEPLPGERLTGELVVEGEPRYGSVLTAQVSSAAGTIKGLWYQWYSGGQPLEKETSQTYRITGSDIGKTVSVRVICDDYLGELRQTTKVIQKAVPAQPADVPSVTAEFGETLAKITLPAGYRWKTPDTVLNASGRKQYAALYTPDEELYEAIELQILVEVSERVCEEHDWDAGKQTKAPECTAAGTKVYTCSVCGKTRSEEIPATGHRNTELRNRKEATCTQAGYSGDKYCKDCGFQIEKGQIIPATDHQNTELRNIKEATCREAGYSGDTYCKDCGIKLGEGHEMPITGKHLFGAGTVVKKATCTQNGLTESICAICQTVHTEEIPATGHRHTAIRNRREATVNQTGYTGDIYCTDCNTKLTSGQEIDKIPRLLKKGSVYIIGNIRYRVTKAGAKNAVVEVLKVTGSQNKLTIPDSIIIDGISCKVTSIAAKALKDNKKISQIILGSNITSIGQAAFSGCKKLKKISIRSANLKKVGKDAIKNIHKKAAVKCPSAKRNAYQKLFGAKAGFQKKTMKITSL